MAISANTLFHFTEKDKLKQILLTDFKPSYSLENLSSVTTPKSTYKEAYIPMVCFCDLVFPQIKRHIDFYGDYGIGLRKKGWGIERGISPIFYVPEASISSIQIQNIAVEISKKIKNKTEKSAIQKHLLNFYKYVKPYEGEAFNKKKTKAEHLIFYHEREWRYVPDEFPALSKKRTTQDEVTIANNKLKENKKLGFSSNDIKYIIVRDENEIPEFVDFIEVDLKKRFPNEKERKILVSKLIAVNQIDDNM